MLDRDQIGRESKAVSVLVESGQLRLFCKSIGETRNVYTDESAAKAAGYRSLLAPPTFGNCLKNLAPESGLSLEELGVDYRYLLHGEEQFDYHQQIFAGDTITLKTKVADIYDKKDGALEFLVLDSTATNQLDELVQRRKTVLVMRWPRD